MSSDDQADSGPARDYEVGDRRPPKHSQFKPGVSGNPQGAAQGQRQSSDPSYSAAAPTGDGHPQWSSGEDAQSRSYRAPDRRLGGERQS